VVDLSKIQYLPLNHAAIMNAPVFDNRPCAMVLAVLAANLGAQKHDADSRLAHGRARSLVGTTGVCADPSHANPMTCRDQTPPKSHKSRSVGEVGLAQTIEQVLSLSPDRIAIFGYAHLPQRAHNQRLIDEAALPGPIERFLLSRRLVALLEQAGYLQLGLDHFARRGDSLATQPLRRNFQGYTTDHADTLIGLGASAIGRLPQGYVQNAVAIADYANRMEQQGFATARGWAMTSEDRLRAFVIERLMCDFAFSSDAVTSHFGDQAQELLPEAAAILEDDSDGFIERTHDGFRLTPRGRPFVRNICARFDAYLKTGAGGARHSLSI